MALKVCHLLATNAQGNAIAGRDLSADDVMVLGGFADAATAEKVKGELEDKIKAAIDSFAADFA